MLTTLNGWCRSTDGHAPCRRGATVPADRRAVLKVAVKALEDR
jgi:hypothetical protein